jgi:hypothetical protein
VSLGSISRANEAYERKLNFEQRKSGHRFITLIMTSDKDHEFYEIGGVEVLQPIEYIENNKTKFKWKKSGGAIKFKPDPMMGDYPVCELLDTPHNRKILATHYNPAAWEIEDDAIDSQIKGLRTKIANSLKETPEDEEFQKQIQELQDGIIGADDLKTKNQLTNKLMNLVSSRGKKNKIIEERTRTSFPKRKAKKPLRSQKNKVVSEMVKVDEHE